MHCRAQADFTPYEGKSVAAAVVDPESAAAQDHDMDLALALQMQEVRNAFTTPVLNL